METWGVLIINIHAHIPWLFPFYAGILGGVFGSFANCMRYRIPRGQSLRYPPSKCDACHRQLRIIDLIPVISYLILRGKCRVCHTKIGISSLIVEILYTMLCVGIVWIYGPLIGAIIILGIFTLSLPLICRFLPL
mgnify:CR=1 FL=1